MTIDIEQLRKDMAEGTQGEWSAGRHPESKRVDAVLAGMRKVAYCQPMLGRPHAKGLEVEANARRISRLPELEKAYLDLLDELEDVPGG